MGVAVVSGSAGGIGRGIVGRLRDAGHTVVGIDIDDGDLTDPSVASAITEQVVGQHGRLDILVNNAGVFDAVGLVHKIDPETWDREIAVNLSAPFFLMRAAVAPMLEQHYGRIVNISSISSGGAYKQSAYGASKLGLISLTKTFANEFATAGITVNAVLPGLIETDKVNAAPQDIRDNALRTIPIGRLGSPTDIGDMVAYLAREESSFITGAAIPVDGGAMTQQLRFGPRSRLR